MGCHFLLQAHTETKLICRNAWAFLETAGVSPPSVCSNETMKILLRMNSPKERSKIEVTNFTHHQGLIIEELWVPKQIFKIHRCLCAQKKSKTKW